MKPRPPFVDFVIEQFSPLGEITARSMMGGWTLYCDGVVFAIIASNQVYLKGDAENIPEFENHGLQPFRPFEDSAMIMKYYQAPADVFENPDAMRKWAGSAVAAGQRASAKKKPKKATSKGRRP